MKIIGIAVITLLVVLCVMLTVVTAIQHRQITVLTAEVQKNIRISKLDAEMTVFLIKDYAEFKQRITRNEENKRNRLDI